MNEKEELQKCIDSPYYFYTKYWEVNGKKGTTPLSEEKFNQLFNIMSGCTPIKSYTTKK